jgi:sensor histidine kinase YesM
VDRKLLRQHNNNRIFAGSIVAVVITLVSLLTIGKPVPAVSLVLVGASRLIYILLIWLSYSVCIQLFRSKLIQFIFFAAVCIILVLPLIPFTMWVNKISGKFYPPFVEDSNLITNHWKYYFHFFLTRALLMGIPVFLIQYREDLISEKQSVKLVNEKLKSQNLNMLLEGLRQQINPHFLFNTLNSLKILIKTDPVRAEVYTIELANVYRYLLQHYKNDLVYLPEEIDFIKSYLSLLAIRFDDALRTHVDFDHKWRKLKLVPLTLQILIENAVKHNTITKENPLHIKIFVNLSGELVVENNLQPRMHKEGSSRFGLYHLNEQYKIRMKKEITIIENERSFSVFLPLT